MAQKQKVNQIIAVIALFWLSAIVLLLTIGFALLPVKGGKVVSPILGTYQFRPLTLASPIANAVLWLLMPIPFVFAFEGGLWRLKEALEMRKQALEYKPKTVWSKLGALNLLGNFLNNAFFLLVFIAIIVFLLNEMRYTPKVFSINIILYAVSIITYLLLRNKLSKAWHGAGRKFQKGMPTYQLEQDGVTIKLVTMANRKYPDPPPVRIRFDEIDDLQVFTYTEAEAFLKYNVGPDFQLSIRQARDFAAYVKGQIPRPSVYTFGGANSNQVLIRGPRLFYMIRFDAEDVSDLIQAYRSYKGIA